MNELTKEECSKCWAVRLCGLCFANSIGADSFDRETKLRQCAGMRASLERRLQTYCSIIEHNPDALTHNGEVTFQ